MATLVNMIKTGRVKNKSASFILFIFH